MNKSSKMVSLFLSTALILGTAGCSSAKKTVYDEEGKIVQQNNSGLGFFGGYFAGRSSGASNGTVPSSGVSAGGQSGSTSSSSGTGVTSGSHGGIGGGGSSAS